MLDSHCHLADETFAADLDGVIGRAVEAGVQRALCIVDATSAGEVGRAAALCARWPAVDCAVGVHPHQAGTFAANPAAAADAVRSHGGLGVAVGEIGLDYHYRYATPAVQQAVFRAQARLARDWSRPVVIHCREAEDDVLMILGEEAVPAGVFHCFTGDRALAARVLDLGFHVSFSGIVTFPKATAVHDAARFVPMDRLLVETDSPFLAPVPHRGRRNEPAFVVHVAARVAELRGLSMGEVVDQLHENWAALFGPGHAAQEASAR